MLHMVSFPNIIILYTPFPFSLPFPLIFLFVFTLLYYLSPAGDVDTFNPDYTKYPLFRKARCYQTILQPGNLPHPPSSS